MPSAELTIQGLPVSPGICIGNVYLYAERGGAAAGQAGGPNHEPGYEIAEADIEQEIARFREAVSVSRDQLARIRRQVAERLDEKHAQIFAAQAEFLEDAELIDRTITNIRLERRNAEFLFNRRVQDFIDIISGIEDEYFKARNSDVLDIANRVTNNLAQRRPDPAGAAIPQNSVVLARDLNPSETTALMRSNVLGLALEKGGTTSHTAIMAKALRLPAVVGCGDFPAGIEQGTPIIVDGENGRIILNPTQATLAACEAERIRLAMLDDELMSLRDQPAETVDGYSVILRGNVERAEEAAHVRDNGARGIGLFRTEYLFMQQKLSSNEEAQYLIYKKVLEDCAPHSVVFRTLDFGGDKLPTDRPTEPEMNPFMGQRAIRLCFSHPQLFETQLRALLRASAEGRCRILVPMISGLEEWQQVRAFVRRVMEELSAAGVAFDPHTPLGAMIEVPSAAIVADQLAQECDFFSIGTNDLIQYTLAVDRGNEKVAYLYEQMHPAVLRLIRQTVTAARNAGISVAVCGEMAADPTMAALLVGMGVDELSMSGGLVPAVKRMIRMLRLGDARAMCEEALAQSSIEGVRRVLRRHLKTFYRERGGLGAVTPVLALGCAGAAPEGDKALTPGNTPA